MVQCSYGHVNGSARSTHCRNYVEQVSYYQLLNKCSASFIDIEWLLKNLSVVFRVFSSVLQENSNIIVALHDGATLKFYQRNTGLSKKLDGI